MASDDKQIHTLMSIPLEVRHRIFEYVAVRDAQPKKLLRYWFEKKEVKAKAAELLAKDPNAGSPRFVYAGDDYESEDSGQDDGGDSSEASDSSDEESDESSDDDEAESDDEEVSEEESDEEDQASAPPALVNPVPVGTQSSAQAQAQAQVPILAAAQQSLTNATQTSMAAQTSTNSTPTVSAVTGQGSEAEDGDTDMEDGNDLEDSQGASHIDSDEEMVEHEDDEGTYAAVLAQPASAPVISSHRKWRHIPHVSFLNFWMTPVPFAEYSIADETPRSRGKAFR